MAGEGLRLEVREFTDLASWRWVDVIHISAHGAPGELLLETAAGLPDTVTAAELADLLDLARTRLKLVTLSACWSAAPTIAEQRRHLGLPVPDHRATAVSRVPSPAGKALTSPVMGQDAHVSGEAQRLRAHLETLPAAASSNEGVRPWAVREELLGIERAARCDSVS